MSESIDLALGVLDHQLVDSDGMRCGKVDDLELEETASGGPRVKAIVVGAPAWRSRGRLGRLAAALVRGPTVRVPWEEVERIQADVELRKPATELRLGTAERRARRYVDWLPGS
jgi:sporulation protein YlmC with PRC-barrel domain